MFERWNYSAEELAAMQSLDDKLQEILKASDAGHRETVALLVFECRTDVSALASGRHLPRVNLFPES